MATKLKTSGETSFRSLFWRTALFLGAGLGTFKLISAAFDSFT